MPTLTQTDKDFINKNLPKDLAEKIFNAKEVNDILSVLNFWLNRNGDCWASNGEDYNDLGRETQRVYDNIYLNG
ncbi:MAG: hypothetical protein RR229_05940 [Oscillospiraceae bacterium]